jgi:hypothetical protein
MRFILAVLCLLSSGMLLSPYDPADPTSPTWLGVFLALVLTFLGLGLLSAAADRARAMVTRTLALVLLCGCAAPAAPSSSVAPEREPDCSFRSATTCWTMAPRVPKRLEPPDSVPNEILKQTPPALASSADTTGD